MLDVPIDAPPMTTGDIAELAGVTRDHVCYLAVKLHLQPAFRAGGYRVFDRPAICQILAELGKADPLQLKTR